MIQENPAAKLHSLLESAQRKGHGSFRSVWANVFEIDPKDTSALLTKYNSLLDLYFSTKKLILENNRLNNEMNNEYLTEIGQALGLLNLNGNTVEFNATLTKEVMLALHFLSQNISLAYNLPDSVVNEDQLKNILADIEQLISNITDSNLPADVKQILVKNLLSIKESLHSYFISGIDGVRESLQSSIGSIIMNNQAIAPEVNNENVKGFFNIITKVNDLCSTINGAKELIAPITKLFFIE